MQNIINGNLLPPNYSIDQNGKVFGVDNQGNTYMTGQIIMRGNQRLYQKLTSPQFISGPQQQQQQIVQQPQQQQYNQTMNYPKAGDNNGNCNIKSTGAYPKSNHTVHNATTTIAKTESAYSVIEPSSTVTVNETSTLYTVNELSKISHEIMGTTSIILKEIFHITLTKGIDKDTLDILSDLNNSIFASTELDEYILLFINTLRPRTGIKITTASDWGEIKGIKGNDKVDIIKVELSKSLKSISDDIMIGDKLELPIFSSAIITDDSKVNNELKGIKSLEMIDIPTSSAVHKLVSGGNVSKIITHNMIFTILDNKIGIERVFR